MVGALPAGMQTLLKRKENFWLIGFATCFSLFAEEKVSQLSGRRVAGSDGSLRYRNEEPSWVCRLVELENMTDITCL